MNEKQIKLLSYISELGLPLSETQAKKHVSRLSDKEMDALLSAFETVLADKQKNEEEALQKNPEEFAKIEEWYQKQLSSLREKEIKQKEEAQERFDEKQDALDEQIKYEATVTAQVAKQQLHAVEKVSEEIATTVASHAKTLL